MIQSKVSAGGTIFTGRYEPKFYSVLEHMKNHFVLPLKTLAGITLSAFFLACNDPKALPAGAVARPAEATTVLKEGGSNSSIAGGDIKLLEIPPADLILDKKQVPVLCYHQVRDYRASDSKSARDYIVPPQVFREQMKALADSGFHTILPEQHYRYLAAGEQLPEKPVLITFDDGCDEQFQVAEEVLKPLGQKAAFFIMTVAINRPNFMSEGQIRLLADMGHTIGLHTWDHNNVKKYSGEDWEKQVAKPRARLEQITGKPVYFFAYPFGLWNREAFSPLKERGLIGAYQLSTARDSTGPLHSIRRIIVPGTWSGPQLIKRMTGSFKG